MGLEYFRSELYYLKFSWLNVGYSFSGHWLGLHLVGMYGLGFLAALCAALFLPGRKFSYAGIAFFLILFFAQLPPNKPYPTPSEMRIAGVQMEFPPEANIPRALDALLAEHPDADVLVLSEYTLDGPVPNSLKTWCRNHQRYLVIGGKDPAPKNNFYDTAFVVGTNGEIVFRQGKSVPIQFFKDGLPAPKQELWDSPWGKIGFCVCYDLSYTRVIDRLVKIGAQMIIVPTMDVVDWGKRQHELHALVAPVRAAEYGIPIFRLASSGISQAVDSHGVTFAKTPFAGEESHILQHTVSRRTTHHFRWTDILRPLPSASLGFFSRFCVSRNRNQTPSPFPPESSPKNWSRRRQIRKISRPLLDAGQNWGER